MTLRIEITCVEFGVYLGAILQNDRPAGTIQLHAADKPKRVAAVIKKLRSAGIPVEFPAWARNNPG